VTKLRALTIPIVGGRGIRRVFAARSSGDRTANSSPGHLPSVIRAISGYVRGDPDGGSGDGEAETRMIFITAKFTVLPEDAERWPEITAEFTAATRGESGCLWFDWSRSLDDPTEYVLVEAFRDAEAGAAHVGSAHFEQARKSLPPHLAQTPRIVNFTVPQDGWSELGEFAVTR